jgi:protein-S-isoprenylcysteine O-methyltransferase Ste14
MTPATMIILTGLIIFWGISLQNILKNKDSIGGDRSQNPMSTGFLLAVSGSLYLFAETLALIALDVTGNLSLSIGAVQGLGLALFFFGSVLHAWSVTVRGRNAVSWAMPENQSLVTDPPYSFVRHPSYLAYMLMIIGLSLIWQQWFTLPPWVAIPGYYMVSKREEALLVERFGEEYKRYQERVGAFIPRI